MTTSTSIAEEIAALPEMPTREKEFEHGPLWARAREHDGLRARLALAVRLLKETPCGCKFYPEDDPDIDVKHECDRCAALPRLREGIT